MGKDGKGAWLFSMGSYGVHPGGTSRRGEGGRGSNTPKDRYRTWRWRRPPKPKSQEGDGEVCGVAQVLHERVHSPRDGLRNEAARDAVRLGECAENCSAKTDRPE